MIRSSPATAKRRRKELAYAKEIRAQVMQRDPSCRAAGFGKCGGSLSWAHLVPRSATRRMSPDQRHTTKASLMLCWLHHALFDAHRFSIQPMVPELGADGPVRFVKAEGTR